MDDEKISEVCSFATMPGGAETTVTVKLNRREKRAAAAAEREKLSGIVYSYDNQEVITNGEGHTVGEDIRDMVVDEKLAVEGDTLVFEDVLEQEDVLEREKVEESRIEESDVNALEEKEFAVIIPADKELFYLNWQGNILVVPFRGEILKDVNSCYKLKTVLAYPVDSTDLNNELFRSHMTAACSVLLDLRELQRGQTPKGFLKLKFNTVQEASAAIDQLKDCKEGMTVKHACKGDSESDILKSIRGEVVGHNRGSICNRMLYVGNLPNDVTEAVVKERFPDALQVIMAFDEETCEPLGYAYLEYENEVETYKAGEKYQDVELDGVRLYIIKAIAKHKAEYGLLEDSFYLQCTKKIAKLQEIIDSPASRNRKMEARKEVNVLRGRVERDVRRREVLHLPQPDFSSILPPRTATNGTDTTKHIDVSDGSDMDEDETTERSVSVKKDRPVSSAGGRTSKSKRPSKSGIPSLMSSRIDPPRLMRGIGFRGSRGEGGGSYNDYSSHPESNAEKLMNQLQGIVSELTKSTPSASSRSPPPFPYDRYSKDSHGYDGSSTRPSSGSSYQGGRKNFLNNPSSHHLSSEPLSYRSTQGNNGSAGNHFSQTRYRPTAVPSSLERKRAADGRDERDRPAASRRKYNPSSSSSVMSAPYRPPLIDYDH